jgi:hypothetical protein
LLGKYLGCYKDSGKRDLIVFIGNDMTVGACFDKAKDMSIRYVGLQYGHECWGGNQMGTYGRVDEEECSLIGNSSEEGSNY